MTSPTSFGQTVSDPPPSNLRFGSPAHSMSSSLFLLSFLLSNSPLAALATLRPSHSPPILSKESIARYIVPDSHTTYVIPAALLRHSCNTTSFLRPCSVIPAKAGISRSVSGDIFMGTP